MGRLMTQSRVIARDVPERLKRRHLDEIRPRSVKSLIAAVPDDRAGVAEEALRSFYPFDRIDVVDRLIKEMIRQAVDLLNVKNRIGLEEGDLAIDCAALVNRLAKTTVEPVSPLRTAAPNSRACLKVIHIDEEKPRVNCSDQSRSTFMPEYGRPL